MKNELAALCAAGLHLVAIPPDKEGKPTKAPCTKGWNKPKTASNPNGYSKNPDDFIYCEGFNFGLYHGASETVAVDLDNVELARKVFEEATNTQLRDWLEDDLRVEIKSPKLNRAKVVFKLPAGFEYAKLRQLEYKNPSTQKDEMVFELRAGNCQDVIYGQHPEGGNYELIGNPAAIPTAPPILLDMLQNWEAWKPCFESALGVEPEPPRVAPRKPQQGASLTGYRCPIQEFNQSYSVADVLIHNGYKHAGKDRYIRPGSESKAPGAVIMRNCADGIERVFSHGGDVLNDGFAHDAFDCMRLLEYGGNFDTALNWSEAITKQNRRLYMQEQAQKSQQEQPKDESKQPFSLTIFSLNGSSAKMRLKMLSDVFVLVGIALLGQATVIYAKPNTGKTLLTLYLLIQSIVGGLIKGEDVFYVNADDTYKGLIEKLELAERYGFNMLTPGHNGFDAKELSNYLAQLTANDDARGKVLILDTVKKFTDLMDKKIGSKFMQTAREFVSKGGTLIMLAHTNKNRDGEGKVVFAGTSDLVDDADCAYTLDEVSESGGIKSVLFDNFKARGDVAKEAGYCYSTTSGQSYLDRLNSIKPLDEQQFVAAKQARIIAEQMEKDKPYIDAILEALEVNDLLKTELVINAHQSSGLSKARINKVLAAYEGKDFSQGNRWFLISGDKNSKVYSALTFGHFKPATASEYRAAKNG